MKSKFNWLMAGASSLALIGAVLAVTGCATPTQRTAAGAAPAPAATAQKVAATGKGGAELWGQTCGHCHNIRSPSSYSDAQWDVVMLHMRVRANLTGEEQRKILQFLKSAN
jgi:cytochrome c5